VGVTSDARQSHCSRRHPAASPFRAVAPVLRCRATPAATCCSASNGGIGIAGRRSAAALLGNTFEPCMTSRWTACCTALAARHLKR
jgi:hypothetical protein